MNARDKELRVRAYYQGAGDALDGRPNRGAKFPKLLQPHYQEGFFSIKAQECLLDDIALGAVEKRNGR